MNAVSLEESITMKKSIQNLNNPEENIDSPINTAGTRNSSSTKSLTPDESADTDPNKVPDKASFSDDERDVNDRGRFDGEVGI